MSTENLVGLAMVVAPIASALVYGLIVDASATLYVLGLCVVAGLFAGVVTVGLALMGVRS